MDVLVTVPKGYDLSAKMYSDLCFWRVRGTPRMTQKGAKMYFIHDGEVALEADVVGVGDGYIEFADLKYLPKPRESHPSFRGIRYKEGS